MTRNLQDRVALVTGSASGIGRATAMRLGTEGAHVMCVDADGDEAEATAAALRAAGHAAVAVRADVSQVKEVDAAVAATLSRFGRLDCAVNCAGILGNKAASIDYARADWDRVMAVNLTGVWLCVNAELRAMLDSGGGAIVNVSSMGGLRGVPMNVAYSAAKHGVLGITRTVALEYADRGIRVVTVCPGVIDTPIIRYEGAEPVEQRGRRYPMGRVGQPEEVAATIAWLCSDAASFVSGSEIRVDGASGARL